MWLLHVALLWFCLLPSLLCDNLRCYHSPILEKEVKVTLVKTECPPNEVCFKAVGRLNDQSVLTTRGCLVKRNCSQVTNFSFNKTDYTMSYDCCDQPYCNSCPSITTKLSMTVALVTVGVIASSL